MANVLPAPLHRALMPLAHRLRHRWRKWRRTPIAGVSVVLTNQSGDVMLLRHSYGPNVWALPSGGLKPGEDPQACARREVSEELGISVENLEALGTIDEILSGSHHTAHIFTATCTVRPKPDKREVDEARFFPSQSLPEPLGAVTRRRLDVWRRRGIEQPR